MTNVANVTSDLFTDSRLFINNFNIDDNSLTMMFSIIWDNSYSLYVPFNWWDIITTNTLENQFLAGLTWDFYFYDSTQMSNIKSNKDFVWLWITTVNNNKFVTWFDEVAWVWYIDDNNAGVTTYADDWSLFPDVSNWDWWGTWDVWGLVNSFLAFLQSINDWIDYIKINSVDLITKIKEFLTWFNDMYSTDSVDLTSWLIPSANASTLSDSFQIDKEKAPNFISNVNKIWISILVLVMIVLGLLMFLYFVSNNNNG